MTGRHYFLGTVLAIAAWGCHRPQEHVVSTPAAQEASRVPTVSCFLLSELGVGEVRRAPAVGCAERVTPASTFKIPHALAALDAGVVRGASTVFRYDGSPVPFPTWQHDQDLASAMRYSVVWYFQRIADALGPAREHEYLVKFQYGNEDATGNPRRFWLEDSLLISPDEQGKFLERFYGGALPVSTSAAETVRDLLVQAPGQIVNATGTHEFGTPWADDTTVSAKTGTGLYDDGIGGYWLVGSVKRGPRTWIFVSCVTGRFPDKRLPAVELAARALHEEHVL